MPRDKQKVHISGNIPTLLKNSQICPSNLKTSNVSKKCQQNLKQNIKVLQQPFQY